MQDKTVVFKKRDRDRSYGYKPKCQFCFCEIKSKTYWIARLAAKYYRWQNDAYAFCHKCKKHVKDWDSTTLSLRVKIRNDIWKDWQIKNRELEEINRLFLSAYEK